MDARNNLFRPKVMFKRLVISDGSPSIDNFPEYRESWERARPRAGFRRYARSGLVNRPFDPHDLSPFWVLTRSANAEVHKEFRSNPKAYSKAPGAWWVYGYRDWTWVGAVGSSEGDLAFELVRVRAFARWGPGREAPLSYPEGTATVSMSGSGEAKKWIDHAAEFGAPFAEQYLADLPQKPASRAYIVYAYVFGTAVAVVVGGVLAGVLGALGFPSWITIPVWLGVSIAGVSLLCRWQRTESPTPKS